MSVLEGADALFYVLMALIYSMCVLPSINFLELEKLYELEQGVELAVNGLRVG